MSCLQFQANEYDELEATNFYSEVNLQLAEKINKRTQSRIFTVPADSDSDEAHH